MNPTLTRSTRARLTRTLHRLLDLNLPAPASAAWPSEWPGLYLGAGTKGPVFGGPQHHALIIGPPRAGKTTRLAVPNLRLHPGPAVVTSTKTDIATATLPWRQTLGTCWIWNPTSPDPANLPGLDGTIGLRWSPVVGCDTWDAAVGRAHALATAARPPHHGQHADSHWVERAQALLAPLLHAAALCDGELAVVLSWLHRRELTQPLSLLETAGSRLAADLLHGIAATDSRELSGIFSTADSLLAAYRTDTALAGTRHPNFDPDRFATSTDTVYLIAPAVAQAQYAPLVICLLDQIRTATYHHRPHPSMLWALDELANIAPLPDLPATIAEGASQGLLVAACLQDLSQARTRWGAAVDGFLTLFTHKLLLPGIADLATLRQVSDLAGPTDIPITSLNHSAHLLPRTSRTISPQQRPRLPIDVIANTPTGSALWLQRTHPAHLGLPPWD